MKNNKMKIVKNTLITVVAVLLVGMIINYSGIFEHITSLEDFKIYIEGFGEKAYIVFFIIQLLSIIIAPIPSNISATAGAMVFGVWQSFFMTMLAIILGSVIVFILSRKFGKKFADRFVSKEVYDKYEGIVNSKRGEIVISLMLLLPFFPDDMINFLVGISNMDLKRYMMILMITRPWGILVASSVGGISINIPIIVWILIIIGVVILIKNSKKIEAKLFRTVKSI